MKFQPPPPYIHPTRYLIYLKNCEHCNIFKRLKVGSKEYFWVSREAEASMAIHEMFFVKIFFVFNKLEENDKSFLKFVSKDSPNTEVVVINNEEYSKAKPSCF